MIICKYSKKVEIKKSNVCNSKGFFAKKLIKKKEIIFDIKLEETDNFKIGPYALFYCTKMFLKHSCNPNVIVLINNKTVKYTADKNISRDEELSCNYNTFSWDLREGSFNCNCGSKSCKKIIKGMKFLSFEEKKRLYPLSTFEIKQKIVASKDRIDQQGLRQYAKGYEKVDKPWSTISRKSFDEAIKFISSYPLPKTGKIVEIGVYKGVSYKKIIKLFGKSNCIGIDIKDYAKLPNLIVQDVRKFSRKIPVKLGINDLPWDCPNSKLAAHKWLEKNVLKNGLILLSGYSDLNLDKFSSKKLEIVFKNEHVLIFKKI